MKCSLRKGASDESLSEMASRKSTSSGEHKPQVLQMSSSRLDDSHDIVINCCIVLLSSFGLMDISNLWSCLPTPGNLGNRHIVINLHIPRPEFLKGNGYTCRGGNTVKIIFSTEKGSTLKRTGSKFFLYRVDSFTDRNWCVGKQTGSHKKLAFLQKLREV